MMGDLAEVAGRILPAADFLKGFGFDSEQTPENMPGPLRDFFGAVRARHAADHAQ